jgi:excisionase family DNA binding protein
MKRMFFIGLQRPNFRQKGERQNMSCSRRSQNLDGTGSADASESLDGTSSIFSRRTPPFEPLLDDVQVAKLLGLHQKTVQKLARSGDIPAIQIGRYWRFRASSLQKWLDVKFSGQPLTKEIF